MSAAYDQLGLDEGDCGGEVFRQLVLARIIEPTSKQDSLRVLAETGIEAVSYATVKRRLQGYADDGWRRKLTAACAAHAGSPGIRGPPAARRHSATLGPWRFRSL